MQNLSGGRTLYEARATAFSLELELELLGVIVFGDRVGAAAIAISLPLIPIIITTQHYLEYSARKELHTKAQMHISCTYHEQTGIS